MGYFCDRSFHSNDNNCIYEIKGGKNMGSMLVLAGFVAAGLIAAVIVT